MSVIVAVQGNSGIISNPVAGSAVAGVVAIRASVPVVEYSVDGVPIAGSLWDTGANPLPPPNHALDYGYMLVDGRYGDFRHEVNEYTNLYHAWARRGYESWSGATDAEWLPVMRQSLANAAAEGRRIQLNLNLQEEDPARVTPVAAVLDLAAPHWNRVVRIELADEPSWSPAETDARVAQVRALIAARGLPPKPLGNVYTRDQARFEDGMLAPGLDFVMIEAYVDAETASEDSQVNIDYLNSTVTEAKSRVPQGKQIGLVMQAYARNGRWLNVDTLRDLQVPTYLLAHNDPRVVAITMFSYGRGSGTREKYDLTTPHRLIGERILGTPMPRAGDGPRTLAVKASDGSTQRITVHARLARRGDFAGDYKADPAVFRPGTAEWLVLSPAIGPPLWFRWGQAGDVPVAGDYVGSPTLEAAVWRPTSGVWHIAGGPALQWGLPGDIPVVGDYTGDARTDPTVFRPSTGTFWVRGGPIVQWGQSGDIPIAGDFTGDRHDDIAVYRPSTGTWFLHPGTAVQWGQPGDIPVAGDFTGDYRDEFAVFRPDTGTFWIHGGPAVQWGLPGDIPVSGDYLGDSHTDLVVYRPSTGTWYLRDLQTGQTVSIPWGWPGDLPISG
ncbi:MAG TPA: hypothetical protein VFC19_49000 [Candidatus Limnocylindrales bacterium]|nr:hypothetical protein [Candidatus Limnocylindrales bacterium]